MNPKTRAQMPNVTPEMVEATAHSIAASNRLSIPADLIKALAGLYNVDAFNAVNLAQALQNQGAISWDAMKLEHLEFFEAVHEITRAQVVMLRAVWMAEKGIKGTVPIGKESYPNNLAQMVREGEGRLVNTTQPGDKVPTFKYLPA